MLEVDFARRREAGLWGGCQVLKREADAGAVRGAVRLRGHKCEVATAQIVARAEGASIVSPIGPNTGSTSSRGGDGKGSDGAETVASGSSSELLEGDGAPCTPRLSSRRSRLRSSK